jgi:hypothetical protein
MNEHETTLMQKLASNFQDFAKELSPISAGAVAATPLLVVATYSACHVLYGIMNKDPSAIATAYHGINSSEGASFLAGLKGDLPYEPANTSYQAFAGSVLTGVAVGVATKVAQTFNSLKSEVEHLTRENTLIKTGYANSKAMDSGDGRAAATLRGKLESGLSNLRTKTDERAEQEQATRVTRGPAPR